ncbi:hypothetical protein AALP_AAs53425U000200 [Arabis alpina]|uniref:Uncharacterized protein n=1 Tax=Arabis alpina TaxID=50452 RepID=A0A087FX30_ARAAL|nr:hypothetical protein AALP_AAs53425U000200 [Arabis alpina]
MVNRVLAKPVVMKPSTTEATNLKSPSRLSTVALPLVVTPSSLPPQKPPDLPLVSQIYASNNHHCRDITSYLYQRRDLSSILPLWRSYHGEIIGSHCGGGPLAPRARRLQSSSSAS